MADTRVRFAPSPTGFLHVGGARTALFNWLYARGRDGAFLLRIEDTDRERSTEEMVRAILDGLAWLGLEPDEPARFQSGSRERHLRDARRLIERGHAYRCFCDPETLRRDREAREKESGAYRYPRTCTGIESERSRARADSGEPFAVRALVPERAIAWNDAVHGPTSFDGTTIEDFVIVRSDGSPTYMLSVVSDDIDMGITDVIRGDDHLSNTPKQIVLYEALGATVPRFAHLPLILGEDKKRLSKRHGAVSVLQYRDRGYLADAMFNFLALLGWNPGDGPEKLSREQLVARFALEAVGRSGAVFDLRKLDWLNGQYVDELATSRMIELIRPHLEAEGTWTEDLGGGRRDWFERVVELLRPRCRTLADFPEQAAPFLDQANDIELDPKAARKHLKGDDLLERLLALRGRMVACETWDEPTLERALRSLAEERGVAAGQLIHPLRLAVTGRGASPGLFEVLVLLGRERSLARLDRMIERIDSGGLPSPASG